MLVKYLRKDNSLIGCLVATGKRQIGYSFCNPRDVFKKDIARKIALGRVAYIEPGKEHEIKTRLRKGVEIWTNADGWVKKDLNYPVVPSKYLNLYLEELDFLIERSEKYYKD